MTEIAGRLRVYCEAQLPRVLTQMDRDPDSPTYGCFDRNYWHYKIRDFPSAILQQGVFALEAVRGGQIGAELVARAGGGFRAEDLGPWSVAALNALSRMVDARGRVSEYYPFEASYPAAAFGLYAAARVLLDWQSEDSGKLRLVQMDGLARLARHLAGRREKQAWNQQAAGLAGLALASKISGLGVSSAQVERIADAFFAAQHPEGWWPEYGGPDFGYLTVTLDALADYFDATGDPRAPEASKRAITFLAEILGADGQLPSTLNSRNTDYVVPYGLARAATENPEASWLLENLFRNADQPSHFLWATDDRYSCHYIYASCVRVLPWLEKTVPSEQPAHPEERFLEGCGYWIVRPAAAPVPTTVYVGCRKGGAVRVHRKDQPAETNHGKRVWLKGSAAEKPKTIWTSNWWDAGHTWKKEGPGEITVEARFRSAKISTVEPVQHVGLRAAAWLFRQHLIPWLKRILIFRGTAQHPTLLLTRKIRVSKEGQVEVEDQVTGTTDRDIVEMSPRQHLRHVASAESFHPEDWQWLSKSLDAVSCKQEKPQPLHSRSVQQSRPDQHKAL